MDPNNDGRHGDPKTPAAMFFPAFKCKTFMLRSCAESKLVCIWFRDVMRNPLRVPRTALTFSGSDGAQTSPLRLTKSSDVNNGETLRRQFGTPDNTYRMVLCWISLVAEPKELCNSLLTVKNLLSHVWLTQFVIPSSCLATKWIGMLLRDIRVYCNIDNPYSVYKSIIAVYQSLMNYALKESVIRSFDVYFC